MSGQDAAVTPSRAGLIVGLMLCVVAIAFEAMAVVTAMPAAEADLGDVELYAWAFTAFMIAQTFAIVAAGLTSDRIGPKWPMAIGFAVFALGLVIAGSAPNMYVLVAGRFVQGLGGGTMNLAVMVLVARLFDARERAVILTWMSFAWMAPSFVGPALAAWIAKTWSWHLVFYSVLPVMAIGGALIIVPLLRVRLVAAAADVPSPPVAHRLRSAAMVALGAAALQVAGQRIEPLSLVWLVAALVLLGFGLPPLLPDRYRPTGSGLSATVNLRMLSTGAFFGADTFLTLMLVRNEGLDLLSAGVVVTIGSAGWTLGSWLQSRPWLRLRRDTIAVLGAAGTAGGLALIGFAAWFPGVLVWLVVSGWVIAGLGMGLHTSSTSLVVMQLSPEDELGRNTSSLQVGEALGNSVAAGLGGTLFALAVPNQTLGFGLLFAAMAMIATLGLASALRIGAVTNHSVRSPDIVG